MISFKHPHKRPMVMPIETRINNADDIVRYYANLRTSYIDFIKRPKKEKEKIVNWQQEGF